MTRFNRKALAVVALSFMTILGACDSADRMQGIAKPKPTPTAQYTFNGIPQLFSPIFYNSPTFGAIGIAEFSAAGGTLQVGAHKIEVPANAVSEPTYFWMRLVPGTVVHVELFAVRKRDWRIVTTFAAPIRLTLSYAGTNTSDPNSLRIAYLVDSRLDGALEGLPTTPSTADQTVTALLNHFSGYVLGSDRSACPEGEERDESGVCVPIPPSGE